MQPHEVLPASAESHISHGHSPFVLVKPLYRHMPPVCVQVRSCASGGLRDPALYPHFAAACKYLVGAVQLDAAALALRRRCEDPSVALAIDSKPPVPVLAVRLAPACALS